MNNDSNKISFGLSGKGQAKKIVIVPSRFVRGLEWMVERLPRHLMEVQLKPTAHIKVLDEQKGEYKTIDMAPEFEMVFTNVKPGNGWYYLETALARNTGDRVASIKVELQEEPNKYYAIPVPSTLRGSVTEVFYLPDNVKALHWTPTSAPGCFSQSPLLFYKITSLESVLRRLYRVFIDFRQLQYLPDFTLIKAFTNLQSSYECSARLRIDRLQGNNYATFITKHDTLNILDIYRIKHKIKKFKIRPLLSIIMPITDSKATALLSASLDSLQIQYYSCWELVVVCLSKEIYGQTVSTLNNLQYNTQLNIFCLENTFEQSPETADLLNRALQHTRGQWVMRLNPGDRLPKHSLYYAVAEINQNLHIQFIYGDDDDLDDNGQRTNPRFKPDWNPDLFTAQDYIGNPAFYSRGRLIEVGGYSRGYEGMENYELRLRFLATVSENRIRHIHKILYHRLKVVDLSDQSSLHEVGRKALMHHFEDTGIEVDNGAVPLLYRIRHPLPSPPPLVSIIIPTRDKVWLLRTCIESIRNKTDYPNLEILVVDNSSTEPDTLDYFRELELDPNIRILHYDAPYNYSAINNLAVRKAKGEVLILLNNDIEVIAEDWLTELVSHAIRPEIGAVGAKLLYPDKKVQHAGVILGIGGVAAHINRFLPYDKPGYCLRAVVAQNMSAVTGACLAVRKTLYQQVGGLDEKNLKVAYNDIDFCLRLLDAGYKNIYTPYALLYHYESISRGPDNTPEKKEIHKREFLFMKNTWKEKLLLDKAYNKNLSLKTFNFALKL